MPSYTWLFLYNIRLQKEKEVFTTLYEQMLAERRRLDKEISSLQAQLKQFPAGKLICTHNNNYFKWFHSDGHSQTYIPKKNKLYAEQLASKKYLTTLLNDDVNEKRAIDFYLRHHVPSKVPELLNDTSGFRELLASHFQPLSTELLEWMNSPFSKNPKYPEQLLHQTPSGNLVRSKSEVLIDMSLYMHKIPFRYECELILDDITLYPDFTIRHPHTGEYFYWEHFGLMDDLTYSKNACSKLQLYSANGIIPSIRLITTYETQSHPLNLDLLDKIIEFYFL